MIGICMYNGFERRQLERFRISGAQVHYKQLGGFKDAKEVSAKMPLIDFTKISIRFKSKHNLQPGALIELDILIPGKKKIHVKGNVIWSTEATENREGYAVVQFLPFGTDERYNSMRAHDQLQKLDKEYQREAR
jgi:hypothetical protein